MTHVVRERHQVLEHACQTALVKTESENIALQASADGRDESAAKTISKFERLSRLAVIGLIVIASLNAAYSLRGLYADGSYYFWNELSSQSFFTYPTRIIAQIVTQIPVVAAMHLGIDNVVILARFQSFGVASIPMILWVISLVFLLRKPYFWAVVALFAVVFLNAGMVAVGEHNLAYALVVLNVVLLYRRFPGSWAAALLLLSALLLLLSYEALVYLGPLLAVIAAINLIRVKRDPNASRGASGLMIALICIYSISAVLGGLFILFPRDSNNLRGASDLLWPLLNDHQLVISAAIGGMALVLSLLTNKRGQAVGVFLISACCLLLLDRQLWAAPWMHYGARILVGIALFAAIASFILIEYRPLHRNRPTGQRARANYTWIVAASLLAAQLVSFTYSTNGYAGWLTSFDRQVDAATGETQFDPAAFGPRDSSLYVWPWTNPFLSMLFRSNAGRGMILSPGSSLPSSDLLPAPLPSRFYQDGPLF